MQREEFFREARGDLTGPLYGLRVLEATTTWAGPMCGCLLADFGADVVKVEDPRGEIARRLPPFLPGVSPPLSFMHATVNRNKRNLSLDLRQAAGQRIFRELAERVDVVVENFRPGTMAGWGLGYSDLRMQKADLVYVSISGYGQFGPDHDRVGYDPLAQAASGFLSLNGDPDGEPVKSPTFLADDLAGVHAALATLAALRYRDSSGEGQHIDVALLDAMLFQSTGYLTLGAMDVPLPRLGNDFRIAAPARNFACRDGQVMAGVLLDSHWKRLCALIERPELADHPDYARASARIERRDEVNALLASWTRNRTREEVVDAFSELGIPAAAIRSYAEAARDVHVRERDMLQDSGATIPSDESGEVEPVSSTVPITGPAAKLSRTPIRVRNAAPALGEHNHAILAEIGYDADAIRELSESGVI